MYPLPAQFTPPSDFRNLDPSIQSYIHQLVYAQYMQHQQQQQPDNNSYAQIVSNVNKDGNTFSMNLPELPSVLPQLGNNASGQNSPNLDKNETAAKNKNGTETEKKGVINKPLLSLATAYGKYCFMILFYDDYDNSNSNNLKTV